MDIGRASIQELFAALVAEGNRRGDSLCVSGVLPLFVALRPDKDKLAVGLIVNGRFEPSIMMELKTGLPMGEYHLGLFMVKKGANEEATQVGPKIEVTID